MKIEVDDGVETIPYLSPKNEIKKDDDADTIFYVSPYNSPKHEIDEKIYVEPKLETIKESEQKTVKTEDDFIKSVIDENKVDIQISKEIKKYNEKILQTANCMIKYHLGFLISIKRGLTL